MSASAIVWAWWAKLDEVTSGQGKVIPSRQLQVVQNLEGGIVKAEGAMYASKVMPICPKCGKAVRVGHVEKDGKMVRVCKKCGAEL